MDARPDAHPDHARPPQAHGAGADDAIEEVAEEVAEEAAAGVSHLVEHAVEAELASGRREATPEAVKRSLLARLAIIIGGTVCVITGLILLVIPGPGMVVLAIGLGLLATEVPFAARLLERVKKRLPQDADGKLPRSAIVTMVVMTVLATSASIAWMFVR